MIAVAVLAAPSEVLKDADTFKPSAMKSAAECHSTPRVVAPAAKPRPVGALAEVVPAIPCSPPAPGIETACVPAALPAFNSSRAEPSVNVNLIALSSSADTVPSSTI